MKRALIPTLMVVAACGDPPPFELKFQLTDGAVQACTTASGARALTCSDIPMPCASLVSVRMFAPGDPTAPFISACTVLQGGGGSTNTLCQLASVDLMPPAAPIKAQNLEIDIAVYDATDKRLKKDTAGNLLCPSDVAFSGDGFLAPPEPCGPDDGNCNPPPAIGGRGFYHPGDTETFVTLGCSDLSALDACVADSKLDITASVSDFDTAVSVSSATADGLIVSVGEPAVDASTIGILNATNTHPLDREPATVPAWSTTLTGFVPLSSACIEVLEDGVQTTAAVACTNNIGGSSLDLPGVRLPKGALDEVLAALPSPGTGVFPQQGLVIGKALTFLQAPARDVTITPSDPDAHILYLSDDGTTFVGPPTVTATGVQGIWISRDAKYGTIFHAQGQTAAPDAFGGLIAGKANIVITQLKPPGNG
jgi:hypothetical protein